MRLIRQLPDAEELRRNYSLSESQKRKRMELISEIQTILGGQSNKKILCIGPCSADREDAVLEYMLRLAKVEEQVSDRFLIIPRIYTSKPRTNGCGYKGLLHRQDPENGMDNLFKGILATRQMHLHIIQETGMFGADEMLYPEAHFYISDLLAYTAIGARSVENQQHRLVSSGLDMPVGMKNPTSGNIEVMLNAVQAAQSRQNLLYHGWECHTDGNPYAHAILRGYSDLGGKIHPNYHYESLCDTYDSYMKKNLKNSAVIVDCNHSNSRKHYDDQIRIGKEVFSLCKEHPTVNSFVKGLMIESYLVDGSQMIGENIYGKSITDPCLGWEKTLEYIKELYSLISE